MGCASSKEHKRKPAILRRSDHRSRSACPPCVSYHHSVRPYSFRPPLSCPPLGHPPLSCPPLSYPPLSYPPLSHHSFHPPLSYPPLSHHSFHPPLSYPPLSQPPPLVQFPDVKGDFFSTGQFGTYSDGQFGTYHYRVPIMTTRYQETVASNSTRASEGEKRFQYPQLWEGEGTSPITPWPSGTIKI
jgi:hypothetical protein